MAKKKRSKYKKKLRKYAKKTRRMVDSGVRIWNRLNTKQNKTSMKKLGKKANKMQQNILDMI